MKARMRISSCNYTWLYLTLLQIFVYAITCSNGLGCPHCNRQKCKYPTNCPGGLTYEPYCGCCLVCAKVLGESCGGPWGSSGHCDKGLECYISPFAYTKGSSIGVCRHIPVSGYAAAPTFSTCRPACTPEYCMKDHTAICSATNNAIEIKTCRGGCQHTSCDACSYIPVCHKCAVDDFKCLKRYGRCLKRKRCNRSTFPCPASQKGSSNTYHKMKHGIFQCGVPDCIPITEAPTNATATVTTDG
ncbi:uncharacterized protein TRIADDRAFT_54193 [Trichoplax adhaerens]|uniref:IGFBP N-terminal domain-containing protein n=1 Tax=Trichoplax adhaerens TaxID=10228 RepID=B3RRD1_TRIAD|nr:hypothetical protein TRIADDRAFT_54193 [Trichoplax adhaerens]EDV26322.1 hypothetical protein TRIADDRAFT_54193 [Trichoplax adhaerens]|eukprot:XP_002110318.1 hypothetical protein TRIADDRAFT_54193 [Trichoplax adhaerens]